MGKVMDWVVRLGAVPAAGSAESSFLWHVPVRSGTEVRPVGKLTRAHYLGDPEKRYVDERGQLFWVSFFPRQTMFLCNVTKE